MLAGDLLVRLLPHSTGSGDYLATKGVVVALEALCFACSVALWMFGVWFLGTAVIVVFRAGRSLPFGVFWWGLIFPTVSI